MTAANLRQAAEGYLATGISVLPAIRSEKRPALPGKWEPYKKRLPTASEVGAWFSNGHDGLCVVCGGVSGNLEILDFDCGGELYNPWRDKVAAAMPGILERLVVESTPSGGWHVAYRSTEEVCGSIKLAQRKYRVSPGEVRVNAAGQEVVTLKGKDYVVKTDVDGSKYVILTLIETRGEGGLCLCAPTQGYGLVQGSLTAIQALTAQERESLLEAAWLLNEYWPAPVNPAPSTPYDGGLRPGDDFNQRGDIREILVKHGWSLAKQGENEYWRRPGKDRGWSATLKGGVFYVFSANADPFEPNEAYSPFTAYALLEHGGDYAAAAGTLRAEGYGGDVATGVDLSQFMPIASPRASEPDETRLVLDKPKSFLQLSAEYPSLRDPVVMGLLREGETMNVISSPKIGKALAVNTPILAETGWTTMGDIRPGMKVHAAAGTLTEVVAVSEVMHGRPCYRVTTKSGASVVADENHLWSVKQRGHADVVATKDLARGYQGRRWQIPVAKALVRERVKLPLDPWLLGYWLGKGVSNDDRITIDTLDIAPVHAGILRAGFDICRVSHEAGATTFTVNGLKRVLGQMGLLDNKHIPQVYLTASIEQRAALLAGLMDSDGYAVTGRNGAGQVEFCCTEPKLAIDAFTLIRSLGYKASCGVGRAMLNGVDCGPKMRIAFAAGRKESPFSLHRKTDALPARSPLPRSFGDAIVSVEPVPSVPVRCIQVAHPTGTFLAGEAFMVTHNSWLVIDLALAVATGRPWLGMETVQGDCLIVDNELHGETIANRIPKVAAARGIDTAEFGSRLYVQNLRGRLQNINDLGPYFRQFAPGRFKVVILDAFYRFMPERTDENDNGSMAGIYNIVDNYANYLKCSFVLIHHTSKGNQSLKDVTDVGAGAGAQSRATDTHLTIRKHEAEGVVVIDAAVRSFPPIEPRCLRWTFPIWTPAYDLDPAALRKETPRKANHAHHDEPEPALVWDPALFAQSFIDAKPSVPSRLN